MTSDDKLQAQALFHAALKRDPEERDAFVLQACEGNSRLHQEVVALLAARPGTLDHALDGRLIGPYIIRHEIGRGGMGVVYLAEDTRLARRVALKALVADLGREAGQRERLRQEARAAAGLSHQGIATVYALEEIGAELYLACEYVAGRTLRAILTSETLALAEVVSVASQIARALAVAHASGVVHRDLKPENIIRTAAGVVKILDFGIARVEGATSTHLTRAGSIIGTPAYMAPEQAQGRDVDFRTDLFAFGVLVYEMASGSNPFDAGTVTATIGRIIDVDPIPLSQAANSGSPLLDEIVATCLKKHPADRYRSTQDLVADLDRLSDEENLASPRRASGSGPRPAVTGAAPATQALAAIQWWQWHQLVISAVYVLMVYPMWRVRLWLLPPWGLATLFAVISCAAVGTTLRLNLWFTARVLPDRTRSQLTAALPWIRVCEIGFVGIQLAAAVLIGNAHPEFATLLLAVSLIIAVSSLVIEPATMNAAFGEKSR
jgi:hypothetical protein